MRKSIAVISLMGIELPCRMVKLREIRSPIVRRESHLDATSDQTRDHALASCHYRVFVERGRATLLTCHIALPLSGRSSMIADNA